MTATDTTAPAGFDYEALAKTLANSTPDNLHSTIVNAPFSCPMQAAMLFLGIVVLLIVDEEAGTINRVALSDTELAKNTTDVSMVPFEEIKIPLNNDENIIAQAIRSGELHDTTDWRFLFTPVLNAEDARINQASGGIAYSAVYPLKTTPRAAMIFSYFQYAHDIGEQQHEFMKLYSELVAAQLSR
ncbi:MAG: hypothetical protein JWO41_319 [Candidatus Saccharibacteria bacterium]|nr:hypothetical protein [Candidatus Saccharibacteria bacterium]